MKTLTKMLLAATLIISCSKKEVATPQPTAQLTYVSAAKVYSGSSFTLRITFNVSGAANIQTLQIYKALNPNNKITVNPITEGQQSVIDATPAGIGNGITYYFDGTKKDGTKINQTFVVNY